MNWLARCGNARLSIPSLSRRQRTVTAFIVTIGAGWACWTTRADAYVYWASSTTGIGRANLDGSSANSSFVSDFSGPVGVAVDGSRVYWANHGTTVGRANLDGSGINESFIGGANSPEGVAVDGSHIYWANNGNGTIGRSNLDGSNVTQSFISGATGPDGVAVDNNYVYWANNADGTIGRANIDGSGATQTFITGASSPTGVAVDGSYVYWSNSAAGTIARANLDGSGVTQSFITGASAPGGVAVDGSYIYWTDGGFPSTIGRANLDGSGVNQSFTTGLLPPLAGVAVDGGPAGSASPDQLSLPFASQPVGTYSAPRSLTVTNTGHGDLEIAAAYLSSGNVDDYLTSYDGCSGAILLPNEACTVDLRFGPSQTGASDATLTVLSNDPAGDLDIPLSGTGAPLQAGPTGPPGPAGPIGPTGAAGSPGSAGSAGKLVLVAFQASVGPKRVSVRYALTADAAITLSVKPPKGRASVVAHALGQGGLDRIAWNRELHGTTAPHGRYTLTVTASAGGHSANSSLTVRL
jgi:hypothetical protein